MRHELTVFVPGVLGQGLGHGTRLEEEQEFLFHLFLDFHTFFVVFFLSFLEHTYSTTSSLVTHTFSTLFNLAQAQPISTSPIMSIPQGAFQLLGKEHS